MVHTPTKEVDTESEWEHVPMDPQATMEELAQRAARFAMSGVMKAEGERSQAKAHQLAAMSQRMMQLAVEENAHGEELVTQADNALKGMPMEKPTDKKVT